MPAMQGRGALENFRDVCTVSCTTGRRGRKNMNSGGKQTAGYHKSRASIRERKEDGAVLAIK